MPRPWSPGWGTGDETVAAWGDPNSPRVASGIYALVDHEAFVARTISALPRLISCDRCGYNEFDSRLGRLRWVTHPATVKFPGGEQVFQRYASEHPLILHRQQTRDARA